MFIANPENDRQDAYIDMHGLTVTERSDRLPTGPIAVVCMDGCETVLVAAANTGRKVLMVTAKEKLRDRLSPGLLTDGVIVMAFSSEKATETHKPTHGISGVEELAGEHYHLVSLPHQRF